jgi:hypothetical protein
MTSMVYACRGMHQAGGTTCVVAQPVHRCQSPVPATSVRLGATTYAVRVAVHTPSRWRKHGQASRPDGLCCAGSTVPCSIVHSGQSAARPSATLSPHGCSSR